MVKNLADLRAERSTARPTIIYRAVVGEGQKHVAEVERLTDEHNEVVTRAAVEAGPRKSGQKTTLSPRAEEIRARLAELHDLMAEYAGDLTIAATKDDGEWVRWRLQHPARPEGEPGHDDDLEIARGVCNADDLIEDIEAYVVAWEGEPLQSGDFEALNLPRPDKKEIASLVVGLYEEGANLPKLLTSLSMLRTSSPSSGSPETSESVSADSSAGSPPSDTSTSTPTDA